MDLPLRRKELAELYHAIGSEERLLEILNVFYLRMANDTMLGFFFANKNLEEISGRQASFLLRAMGERPSYTGKPPSEAHDKIPPILSGHFDRRLVLLRETLVRFKLPSSAVETWIRFEETFRSSIVGRGAPSG